ncbi:unnamed protein product [Cochlearia groenlandica]
MEKGKGKNNDDVSPEKTIGEVFSEVVAKKMRSRHVESKPSLPSRMFARGQEPFKKKVNSYFSLNYLEKIMGEVADACCERVEAINQVYFSKMQDMFDLAVTSIQTDVLLKFCQLENMIHSIHNLHNRPAPRSPVPQHVPHPEHQDDSESETTPDFNQAKSVPAIFKDGSHVHEDMNWPDRTVRDVIADLDAAAEHDSECVDKSHSKDELADLHVQCSVKGSQADGGDPNPSGDNLVENSDLGVEHNSQVVCPKDQDISTLSNQMDEDWDNPVIVLGWTDQVVVPPGDEEILPTTNDEVDMIIKSMDTPCYFPTYDGHTLTETNFLEILRPAAVTSTLVMDSLVSFLHESVLQQSSKKEPIKYDFLDYTFLSDIGLLHVLIEPTKRRKKLPINIELNAYVKSRRNLYTDVDTLLCPFLLEEKHWVGVVVNLAEHTIIVLDCNEEAVEFPIVDALLTPFASALPYVTRQLAYNSEMKHDSLDAFEIKRQTLNINLPGPELSGIASVMLMLLHANNKLDNKIKLTRKQVEGAMQHYAIALFHTVMKNHNNQ